MMRTSMFCARQSPLMAAAHGGHAAAVRALLAHRTGSPPPKLDAWDENGETALMIAARGNQTAIVRALLAAKPKPADPNRVSERGQTALIMAAHFDHTQVVEALLDSKATKINLQVP